MSQVTKGSKIREVRILFDTGATGCFIHEKHAKKLRAKCTKLTEWKTGDGCVNVSQIAKTHLTLPELHSDRVTECNFDIVNADFGCDIIIGTDLMADLGIDLHFLTQELSWDEATVPFESKDAELGEAYFVKDSEAVSESLDRVKRILDAKHEKADLVQICKNADHLDRDEQEALLCLLQKHERLFDGTLGRWTDEEFHAELKPGVKPHHARAYPIPHAHEATL